MTELRKKRLLLLAAGHADHKAWYSSYCELSRQGLTGWILGTAYLLPEGEKELQRLLTST